MLEEEDERGGLKEGDVGAKKLGFAGFWSAMGRWLWASVSE